MTLGKGSNGTSLELDEGIRNAGFQEKEEDDGETVNTTGARTESTDVHLSPDGAYTQIKPYAGMPKEVLLLYSRQARYRVPREILFWFTIFCTLVLVALTITLIALSPGCLSWWQSSPVYQIYPRSFKDSDGDGVGDIKGIELKLNHFLDLNIKAIWIGPIYASPMKDFGYDVKDFKSIDSVFGTMQDFEDLLAAMHNKGLKMIMDFIPNHTSDKHDWFHQSQAKKERYKDYYIWADCNQTTTPNNWVTVLGHSAWTYDEVRGQCYYHQFLKEQPDLNLRNPHVRREMTDILRFWLGKGVDGFRMGAAKHILEAKHLRDEPRVEPAANGTVSSAFDLHHDYTTTQLGLHDLLRGWRAEMDVFSREPGRYRVMVTESYDYEELDKTMMYYGTPQAKESDLPFNFHLMDLPKNRTGTWARDLVSLWMSNMPEGKWPNWVVGNHDQPRVSSVDGEGSAYVRVINMLLLTLPGTPTTYYGEEIGMENIRVNASDIQDPFGKFDPSANRDPSRSPMQWGAGPNAGFSNSSNGTWLPVHPDFRRVNVAAQKNDDHSVLSQYETLSRLRQAHLPLHRGWMCHVWSDASVYAYLRELDGLGRAFLVVLNLGRSDAVTDLSAVGELPERLTLVLSTVPEHNDGRERRKSSIATAAGEGLLLEYSADVRYNSAHSSQCYVSEKACYLGAFDILYKC